MEPEQIQEEYGPVLRAAADIVFVPSKTEAFGLVAAEGLAYGALVVTTGVGGLRDFLVRVKGDGRWAKGEGRWAMGKGRWAKRAMGEEGEGRRAMGEGRWAKGDGQRAMAEGRWPKGDGRRAAGGKD